VLIHFSLAQGEASVFFAPFFRVFGVVIKAISFSFSIYDGMSRTVSYIAMPFNFFATAIYSALMSFHSFLLGEKGKLARFLLCHRNSRFAFVYAAHCHFDIFLLEFNPNPVPSVLGSNLAGRARPAKGSKTIPGLYSGSLQPQSV